MTPDTELKARLERTLGNLPAVPATAYLHEGRRARRRRRAVTGLLAAPVLALGAGVGSLLLAGGDDGPSPGREARTAESPRVADPVELGPDPDLVAPEPNNPVEAVDGLDGIDWFTTEDVPEWATEYGNHGPVALTADGRLWVAPDTVVRQVVVDPYRPEDGGKRPITASYAVEAQYPGAPEEMADDVVWVIIATDGTGRGGGTMDEPGRWTDDFELWVDNETSQEQGRPSFAERLARFADHHSSEMVAGARGVRLVQQAAPELGHSWGERRRWRAAEVSYGGERWYVVGVDPVEGAPWYESYPGDSFPDFDAFLTHLAGNR